MTEVQFYYVMSEHSDTQLVQWNKFEEPRPYVSVMGFAIMEDGTFPIVHRGPNVRSVKNVWSLPGGLHEVGLTLKDQFITELGEEIGLSAKPDAQATTLGVYDNIVLEENWHWVCVIIKLTGVVGELKNLEPHKHDEVKFVTLNEWCSLCKDGLVAKSQADWFINAVESQ